jgi:hypothetical protein
VFFISYDNQNAIQNGLHAKSPLQVREKQNLYRKTRGEAARGEGAKTTQ